MEFDVHIMIEPQTKKMQALYTISIGKQCLCRALPFSRAMVHLTSGIADRAAEAEQ